ncbi:PAAR domain-containing protein [Enterobacter sp. CFBP8995]|nr:PAAR domain-containing protein [Enterobacter sp. CFBP8995]
MKGIIRLGDSHTGGGLVLEGSIKMKFSGVGAARKGDAVICPIIGHGKNFIAEGHATFKDNGVPVAFQGHRCACGCELISSLTQAVAE